MGALRKQDYTTPLEYLAWERTNEGRSEYHDGVVVAMAGASWEHNLIVSNLLRRLGNELEPTDCVAVANDMRVRVPECNRYFYPDIVIVCGDARFEDDGLDTLLNPTLIIEALSDTAERMDRRVKADCYRTLPTLQTYVLTAQDEPRIETFTRQADGTWQYDVAQGLTAVLPLPAVGCALRLADVYARVAFPPSLLPPLANGADAGSETDEPEPPAA